MARCALAFVLALAAQLVAGLPAALALKAIDVSDEAERIEISALGEGHDAHGDTLQIETVAGADGVRGRMSVRAATPGTSPSWFVFALVNTTDKPVERWLVADRYATIGSGVVWPDLDARRIEAVTPSVGYVPERIKNDRADVFRLNVEAGQTVTFVVELASDRYTRLQLWKALEYEQKNRDRQLFNGIMLGITGLLAIFLTAVFAANHKAIFPAAAGFTWCVLAYLCVDFGFWHKLFNVRPEENAQYRAAGEAAMAAGLLVFLHTFLRLGSWHGFVRVLLALWIAAQLILVAVAFVDPRTAATFARLSSMAIAGVGATLVLFLALRGQDRALSLVPTWMLLFVWLFGAGATFIGRLSGDIVVFGLTAGLVMIVVLIGFTVTQYAFRTMEPLYGVQPGEQQLRSLAIDGAGAGVWEWNARRDEIKVSPLVEATLGLKPGELSAKTVDFAKHMHPADRERYKMLLWSVKERAGGELRTEFRMRHVDSSYRWFELEAASVPTADRRNLRCVGLLREVTDSKRAQERLMHDAVHDSLSGLPNRELFVDRLAIAAKRAAQEPLVRPAVVIIDLDKFKSVNAALGLVVGDSLLLNIARRLERNLGPQDTLARVGGDQFALLLMNQADPRELAMLAEQVRRSLRAPISIAGREIVLTASIGIALYNGPEEEPAALLRQAEIAMYRAKRAGPDRIEIYNAGMRFEKDSRVTLEEDLRRALEKRQLRLVYQPIYYLPTETLAGFEALLRWDHPTRGVLSPPEFMSIAEASDLIVKLGSFVLARAVREASRWQKDLPRPDNPLFVSVNVASRQLFRPELVNEVRHLLARAVIPKGSLRLEITEALVMENPERATQVLRQLAEAGAGLSLDDFGAGYSSLSYLSQFAFDAVKVDRAFLQAGDQNGTGPVVLRSMVALSHELGKKVVAEGVETEDDVAFLRTVGCEYGQGAYYGEPKPEREALQLVKDERRAERRMKKGSRLRKRTAGTEAEAPTPTGPVPAAAATPVIPPAAGPVPMPVATQPKPVPPTGNGVHPPPSAPYPPAPWPQPGGGFRRGWRVPGPPPLPGLQPPPPAKAGPLQLKVLPPNPLRPGPQPAKAPEPTPTAGPPPPATAAAPAPETQPGAVEPTKPAAPAAPAPAAEPIPAAATPAHAPPTAATKPAPPPVPAKPSAPQRRPTPPHLPTQASHQPPKSNGRQQPVDFSSLPPAIAESLAKLAGRTVPPLSREEAAAAGAEAGETPGDDKPRQS
jgi:diguanylate cyclase (GGDEF)-like protein/PAS domain S-box-containing protein